MSREPENIDRIVRERLDGFEMTPPADVWNNTEAALIAKRKKKGIIGWYLLGILGVLLLGLGGYFYFGDSVSKNTRSAFAQNKIDSVIQKSNNEKNEIKDSNKNDQKSRSSSSELDQKNASIEADTQDKAQRSTHSSSVTSTENQQINSGYTTASVSSKKPANVRKSPEDNLARKTSASAHDQLNNLGNGKLSTSFDQNSTSLENNTAASDKTLNGSTNPQENVPPSTNTGSKNKKTVQNDSHVTGLDGEHGKLSSHFIGSLPVTDVQTLPLNLEEFSKQSFDFSQEKTSFLRHLSFDAALGLSAFRTQADKKTTDPNLSSLLRNSFSGRSAFDARVGINVEILRNFSFQTGLEYSSFQENLDYQTTTTQTYTYMDTIGAYLDSVTQDSVYIVAPVSYDSITVVSAASNNRYRMFTLPFQFAVRRRLSVRSELELALGGAITLFGTNTGVTISDTSGTTLDAAMAYRTSGVFSFGASLKYLYYLNARHQVYAEPWMRFGISNQGNTSLPYTFRRNQYGLRIGYRFKL